MSLGQICFRCDAGFLAPELRSLCPGCFLGSLSAADRGRLLGHLAATGRLLR